MALNVVRVVIAVFTILVGIYSIIWPGRVQGFTGLAADSPRATSEIRAVLGGVFVALGLAPLVFGRLDMLKALGLTYAVIAAVRIVSIFVDQASEQSNWVSLGSEIAMAVLLLTGWG